MTTKKTSASLKWCFTYNLGKEFDAEGFTAKGDNIEQVFKKHSGEQWLYALEKGEQGEWHFQGFVKFKFRKRWSTLGLSKEIHWEYMKGSVAQNVAYCSKEMNHDRDYWSHGVILPRALQQISLNELRPWQRRLVDLVSGDCNDRIVHWYWSAEGNIGKSTMARYLVDNHMAFCCSGKGQDMKYGYVAIAEKLGGFPPIIVVDIPRSNKDVLVSWSALEQFKDGLLYNSKYESGMARFPTPHIVVFSNYPPNRYNEDGSEAIFSEDRWHIVELKSLTPIGGPPRA